MREQKGLPQFFYGDGRDGAAGGLYSGSASVPDCPEIRLAQLVDVAKAGNIVIAVNEPKPAFLKLTEDNDLLRVDLQEVVIGWLPIDVSAILKKCIEAGLVYDVTLIRADNSPKIEVKIVKR